MKILYETGIGEKGSLEFGMVESIKQKKPIFLIIRGPKNGTGSIIFIKFAAGRYNKGTLEMLTILIIIAVLLFGHGLYTSVQNDMPDVHPFWVGVCCVMFFLFPVNIPFIIWWKNNYPKQSKNPLDV